MDYNNDFVVLKAAQLQEILNITITSAIEPLKHRIDELEEAIRFTRPSMTEARAVEYTGLKITELQAMRRKGKLNATAVTPRKYYYQKSDLDALLATPHDAI